VLHFNSSESGIESTRRSTASKTDSLQTPSRRLDFAAPAAAGMSQIVGR
jgi:hypothetical protein